VGAIMLLPYVLLDLPFYKDAPWLTFAVMRLIEMVEAFVVLAMVFVWYRPPWLRGLYLKAERRMSWLYYLVCAAFCLGLVWGGVWSASSMLFDR
jgi:hypothetical protein